MPLNGTYNISRDQTVRNCSAKQFEVRSHSATFKIYTLEGFGNVPLNVATLHLLYAKQVLYIFMTTVSKAKQFILFIVSIIYQNHKCIQT